MRRKRLFEQGNFEMKWNLRVGECDWREYVGFPFFRFPQSGREDEAYRIPGPERPKQTRRRSRYMGESTPMNGRNITGARSVTETQFTLGKSAWQATRLQVKRHITVREEKESLTALDRRSRSVRQAHFRQ